MEKQLIPQLRFPHYNVDWEIKELGNIVNVYDSLHQTPKAYTKVGFPMIRVTDVNNGSLNLDECYKVTESVFNQFTQKYKPQKNNIILSRVGTCGYTVILTTDDDVCLGQNTVLLQSKINSRFLHSLIKTRVFQKQVDRQVVGSTQKTLSLKILKKFKLAIPSSDDEQQKIASFLTDVDINITKLTKKKNFLEQYKKGIMQKIFSQELRFKDEKGNAFPKWRKGRIDDFGYFYYGKSAPKFSLSVDAPTPCVRYGELYSTYDEVVKEIQSYTNIEPDNLKFSKGGEVLVPRVGEDPLDFANCSYLPIPNVAIGEMISVYNTKEHGLFMTYYFNAQLREKFARVVEGANVSNLYFKYLEDIEIEIPSIEEQDKIVSFLSDITSKIDALKIKIEKAQSFKKALLQKMFV